MSLSKVHFNEQGVILNAEKLDRKLVELEKLIELKNWKKSDVHREVPYNG